MNDKRELSKNERVCCAICIIILAIILGLLGLGLIPMAGPVEEDPSDVTTILIPLQIIPYSLLSKLS
jgi:hypothetical protein